MIKEAPLFVQNLQQAAYEYAREAYPDDFHINNHHTYNQDRYFFHKYEEPYPYPNYELLLPKCNGQHIKNIIENKINQAKKSNGEVTIVDLGCGPTAYALRELVKKLYPIDCTGVNAWFWDFDELNMNEYKASIKNVHLYQEDIQKVHEFLPADYFDIAVSVFVFPYLADPYQTIEAINIILKPDGYAFITDVPITPVIPEFVVDKHKIRQFVTSMKKIGTAAAPVTPAGTQLFR